MASPSAPIDIRPTPANGVGVFATRRIKAGDRILAESPVFPQHLFVLYSSGESSESDSAAAPDAAMNAFLDLPISTQDAYLHLSYCNPEAEQQQAASLSTQGAARPDTASVRPVSARKLLSFTNLVGAIYNQNAFEVGKRADNGTVATNIFLTASRLNHSCVPNASRSWNEQLQQKTVHALRDIEAGEEITVSYISTLTSTPTRKQWLKDGYGFECTCVACDMNTPTGFFISGRRARMQELHESLMTLCDCSEGALQKIVHCRELLVLTDKEGMTLWECRGRIYYMLSGLYELMGDTSTAVDWLEAAADNAVLNFGGDDPLFIEILHELEMLKQRLPRESPMQGEELKEKELASAYGPSGYEAL